jgi:general secretion pathway protein G
VRGSRPAAARRAEAGVTYLELIAVAAMLTIMASAILPMAKVTVTRQREIELRRALREIRTAIDRFKLAVDQGQIAGTEVKVENDGYPPSLETLVKGVARVGVADADRKMKFLRRIPVDPLTASEEWGLRCYSDDPDDTSWCGNNVYDVYSKAGGTALDGTKYVDW